MNGIASELYSWGPPKLKSESGLLEKNDKKNNQAQTHDLFVHMEMAVLPTKRLNS